MGESYCVQNICITSCIVILMFLLFVFVYTNCVQNEYFTAPGLTLTMPPSWFPQNSAKKYKEDDWKTKMYLDRYPFYSTEDDDYLSQELSDKLASTDRFWKM